MLTFPSALWECGSAVSGRRILEYGHDGESFFPNTETGVEGVDADSRTGHQRPDCRVDSGTGRSFSTQWPTFVSD